MDKQQGFVIHITTEEISGWQTALRNLVNLVQDESVSTPPNLIQVVVNGPAVRFLRGTAPEAPKIARMADEGVTITVCSNSLERFGHDPDDIVEGVTTVSSGVAEVARSQKRGRTYLKLP